MFRDIILLANGSCVAYERRVEPGEYMAITISDTKYIDHLGVIKTELILYETHLYFELENTVRVMLHMHC